MATLASSPFRAIKCAVPLKVVQVAPSTTGTHQTFRAIKCAVPLKEGMITMSAAGLRNIPRYQMRGPIEGLVMRGEDVVEEGYIPRYQMRGPIEG